MSEWDRLVRAERSIAEYVADVFTIWHQDEACKNSFSPLKAQIYATVFVDKNGEHGGSEEYL